MLMVGGRRTAAHILLGHNEIEANTRDDLSPIDQRLAELQENLQRENISWTDQLEARAEIARLVKEQNPLAVHSEVAEAVGVSEGQLSKDLQLHEAVKKDPSLKASASKGSALRAATYKKEIQSRIDNIDSAQAAGLTDLRSKLFTADGRDFIRSIESSSIDLVFSDLPYGIDYFDKVQDATKGIYDDSAGTAKDFIADIVPECLRVVKPSGWVVFFMCYEWHQWLQELVHDVCKNHWAYRCAGGAHSCSNNIVQKGEGHVYEDCDFVFRPELPPWIWTRRGSGNHGHWPELHASNRYEMLVVVNAGSARLAKKPVENILDFPPLTGKRLHAMQKPHELCQEIISRTTVVGERVLDICFGSGAHLAAAASLNRDFLGCDDNPDNLSAALGLVAQHYSRETARAIERGKLRLES